MGPVFSAKVLGKYDVSYFQSPRCGLVRTEEPHWLAEAYLHPISPLDTGLVTRGITSAADATAILWALKMSRPRVLDFGGGTGLFTRLMRDAGHDCHTCDPYAQNLLARGFDGAVSDGAEVLTAWEVLEHMTDPVGELSAALAASKASALIFSTTTFRGPIPPPSWGYWSLESGQHVTIYTPGALSALARELDMTYCQLSESLHVFARNKPHGWRWRLISNTRRRRVVSMLLARAGRKHSLTLRDNERLISRHD